MPKPKPKPKKSVLTTPFADQGLSLAEDPHDAAFFEQMRACREPYRRLGDAIFRIVQPLLSPSVSAESKVLDIGCGIGLQTKRLIELGWEALGAEHSPVAVELREEGVSIIAFDLTRQYGGYAKTWAARSHVVICTETAEHIPTQFSDAIVRNMVDAAAQDGVIVWSAAAPGQEWHGHINLQKPEYWLARFEKLGWVPHVASTGALRDLMLATQAQHWMGKENFFVLVPKKRKQLHFTITSTVFNAWEYIERHIESVARQTYPHYKHIIVDAMSTDVTVPHARAALFRSLYKNSSLIQNKQRRLSALENCWKIWSKLPDDEVIVWLDGDDWFAIDNALDVVARTYASPDEPWMTYGSFLFSDGRLGMCHQYRPGEAPRQSLWRASHLKTFRAGLVKKLKPADLQKPDGSWCELAIDRVVMYPLLEMAGDRQICSSHVLSVYNVRHSWWAQRSDRERQVELDEVERLRALPPKAQINRFSRPW